MKKDTEFAALKAVQRHLQTLGWSMVVGSISSIEQDFGKHNFRLIIKFTGAKREGRGK